ncbi:MAG: SDR family oxidoreductase [Anaerolinea sp.]|nr:SDR family oxidoreductase [Anaerolinea sp.]
MKTNQVVLVTGVADYWGARVANRLLHEEGVRVLGVDTAVPDKIPDGLDFIQADVRNPLLTDLLRAEQVDTVCHLAFTDSRRRSEQNFDLNVMGTIKVFGACADAGVRKVVHRSSTAVYGANPINPAFLTESHPLHGSRRYGNTRDMVEIEEFCDGFRQQAPDILLTTLRFANIVGHTAKTALNTLLQGRVAPMLLGFDPMMQIIHEDDVVEALVYAIVQDVPGIFNVAAEGLMPFSRILTMTGTIPVPLLHPLAYWGANALWGTRLNPARYIPVDLDYLRYRWVADTTKMQTDMGFCPQYTAEEALREFVGRKRRQPYEESVDALTYDEARLRDTLERRRRQKERFAAIEKGQE